MQKENRKAQIYCKQITHQHSWSNLQKNLPHIEFYHHAQFSIVSHTVCMHGASPQNLGNPGTYPFGIKGVADSTETCYSPMCAITSNIIALGQTIWAKVIIPQNCEDAGMGAWLSPKNTLNFHVLAHQISSL